MEVADIFRAHGAAWLRANADRVSLGQLKVMSAIKACRTAALGGHVTHCEECTHTLIAHNSCRNRHCPKCQGSAAREWLAQYETELLPVPYYHMVFTLPAPISDLAYQNKEVIYDILFKASAETILTIAADPKHLGARIGITSVLHTWGSAILDLKNFSAGDVGAAEWSINTRSGFSPSCRDIWRGTSDLQPRSRG
jgi:Transposase zinc-binding domain